MSVNTDPTEIWWLQISFCAAKILKILSSSLVSAPGNGERPLIKLKIDSASLFQSMVQVSVNILGACFNRFGSLLIMASWSFSTRVLLMIPCNDCSFCHRSSKFRFTAYRLPSQFQCLIVCLFPKNYLTRNIF